MSKQSKYNFFVKDGDRVIYFNAFTGNTFSLNQNEHDKMQKLFNDLVFFEENYNSVFNTFKEWGYFVNDNLDELNLLRLRNRREIFSNKYYRMIINPTLECNFRCWYCYEDHQIGHMDKVTLCSLKKHIQFMIEKERITGICLDWFGGEPLLYFDEVIYPLALFAKKNAKKNGILYNCSMTTNASKLNSAMISKMKNIDLNSFQITIDGDKNRHDRIRNESGKPSFDLIMGNIVQLCTEIVNCHVNLRVNYDVNTLTISDMDYALNLIPIDLRSKITIDLQRVWQTLQSNNQNDNEQMLKTYQLSKSLGFASSPVSNLFKVGRCYTCYADRLYTTIINYDGKIHGCTARNYNPENAIGELSKDGRIVWDEMKLAKQKGQATFENETCLNCKYLPVCMGPCSQKKIESNDEFNTNLCPLNVSEISIDTYIKDYYYKCQNKLHSTLPSS